MTTVVGDNSEKALTLSFNTVSSWSADRQIMSKTFGCVQLKADPSCVYLIYNPIFALCNSIGVCVSVCSCRYWVPKSAFYCQCEDHLRVKTCFFTLGLVGMVGVRGLEIHFAKESLQFIPTTSFLYRLKKVRTSAWSQGKSEAQVSSCVLFWVFLCHAYELLQHADEMWFILPTWKVQMFPFLFFLCDIPPNWDTEQQQTLPAHRLGQECKLIWIDVIPGEINAFFNSCNYAPHVNSSSDLHEVIVGATSTDAFLLRFN